jgi:hypothetical protein
MNQSIESVGFSIKLSRSITYSKRLVSFVASAFFGFQGAEFIQQLKITKKLSLSNLAPALQCGFADTPAIG